ncbi:PREDICTED: uncharacterized protein LOC104814209 [Tarenaya hassleriana]|uniref:uncharacterized protein LOC104814209 n=1 Tax=Tarenaya hassleriana TaxID=28532 RepID=UPI00053CAA68|nr:PREDICTED: uncharacterized protein LOC104814209 [Tarenaya hassleriana]
MWCYDWGEEQQHTEQDNNGSFLDSDSDSDFDFMYVFESYKDLYKFLELESSASDDDIRSNFIRLALKWHPDKHKDEDSATSRFQEINEAYQVLSDPIKRREYDKKRMIHDHERNMEFLRRYGGLILTCNGLGMKHSLW